MEYLFYLKKFVAFLVEPLGLVIFLAIFSLYALFKRRYAKAKLLMLLTLGTVVLFSYAPFSNFLVSKLENSYAKYAYKQLDIAYIHVLGSGNNDDTSQPLSSQIGDASIKRVIEGIMIHKQYPKSTLIFTGYAGTTTLANAKINSDLAFALGVQTKKMIINAQPKDTKEEAVFAKQIIGDKPFILVSSAMHLPRAMKLFESLGLHPMAAPTDFKKRNVSLLTLPNVYAFENSQMAMHEYIGALWASLVD